MKLLHSLVFISLFTLSFAQTQSLSLDDVVIGSPSYANFYPDRLHALQWMDKNHFSYVKEDSILLIQNLKGKEKTVLHLSEVKALAPTYKGQHFPSHQWQAGQVLQFNLKGEKLFYSLKDQSIWRINFPQEAQNLDLNYQAKALAYTLDNNLYLATTEQAQLAITQDEQADIINGQTVHRNEFGINKGTFWSPDGQLLAFYRNDQSMVGDYPLVDILAREAQAKMIKYPMAGMRSEEVQIGIYNVADKSTIFLQTGEAKDRYFTNIAWSPDHHYLYIAELNRGQDTMQLKSYDANHGQVVKTLFTESDPEYVEPQTPMVFLPNESDKFLWQSRRDGFNHLYLYTSDGELLSQITQGEWEVTQFLGFDKTGERVLITSTEKSHLERHHYAVSLQNHSMQSLTDDEGMHQALLSPGGDYLLDTWSQIERPLVTDLITIKNASKRQLFEAEDPYADYTLGKTLIMDLPSADSSYQLSCRMILPPDFDSSKVYPSIIYVYGGPHSQLVNKGWLGGVRMWQHYMAQKGYVMLTMDNRGTSYRGADFEQVIHRQLGVNEMADQMMAYDYLCAQPFIDSSRIGVFGWSFGGFMTTSLMTHYPKAFKVGVAGGPVIDWSNYEVMYGERYMDTPEENPEGYDKTNVCHYAKNLQGRLLIIHGGQDPVVVWQHSQKFIRQCVIDGVQLDYFVYPTHEHNVRGVDRVHLMQKITQYFDDFL